MGQTVHLWMEDEDRSGVETGIAAKADQLIETSGDTLKFRAGMNKIVLAYILSDDATYYPTEARINSASYPLKNLRFYKGIGKNFLNADQIYDYRSAPIEIVAGETLTGYGLDVDEAGVAHRIAIVVIVSSNPIPKVGRPSLNMPVAQATATATTADAWTTLTMTLRDDLPAGVYEMYGAKVIHASIIAARFIFPGLWYRPAVVPQTREIDATHPFSEYWGGAVRFAYPGNLPKLEIFEYAGSGTAKIELYLNKISSGLP